MGIAHQTLRTALRVLASIDVLETRQGAGAYITDLKPDKLIELCKYLKRIVYFSHWVNSAFETMSTGEVARSVLLFA